LCITFTKNDTTPLFSNLTESK